MTTSRYLAHSANAAGHTHGLKDHLACVSKLAQAFLRGFPGSEEAALAGLLHDLGKYGDRFQARLRGEDKGLDHWSQGAWFALMEYKAVAAGLAIQGTTSVCNISAKTGVEVSTCKSLSRIIRCSCP
ncbi:MAG: CRISPR-associated endonuclease Cas3'' [Pseudomonadota bacterium]|nr:CRISPR-associated endonuclease Cas3'' [Pseudomonadota bacterium]